MFFVPRASTYWLSTVQTAFWGPARITAIINNSNNSKHLSLAFWVSFCLEMLVRWCVLHRCASTNRRRYAQQPLHRAAFMRTCSYCTQRGLCTEKLLHTDAFTHRGFHAKKLLDAATLYTKFIKVQRCFCTAQHLRTDAFPHRRLSTQTLLHTDAFTHGSFYTKKPLHTTVLHKDVFLSSPPKKTVKHAFELVFFRSLSRPFQIMNANGWH